MRICLTGGAGYVGSVVAAELLKAGHHVIIYDSLSRGHRQAVPAEAGFVQGDIADRAGLDRLIETSRFDAVMHFAALIEAGESMQAPERYFRANTVGTLTLLEAMLEPERY